MDNYVPIGTDLKANKVAVIDSDSRARSTYVIGITGTGKSTLLETMAHMDMQNGDGLCFLDPHGDSVKKLLGSVPLDRQDDVIFWDPGDTEKPFGLNPFQCFDTSNEFIVSRIAESFVKALASLKEFAEIFKSAPRMKDLLEQLAITFVVNQGHTLAETPEFLTNEAYRQQFYPLLSEHFERVRRYWELEFDALSRRDQEERRESSLNKLRRFQTDPVLYGIFGQPKTAINFKRAMANGEIIIVDLSADEQGFIGAFIVWGILQAARSRAKIPESERRPFHLFSDEFQTYMTTAFPDLQAQARKFGVDTVVAHQVQEQLDPDLRAITTAVGNLIVFRVTSSNAERLSREFDTTPPAPPQPTFPRRQARLALTTDPWKHLVTRGHKNSDVVAIISRIRKLFFHRNAVDYEERANKFGRKASGITIVVEFKWLDQKRNPVPERIDSDYEGGDPTYRTKGLFINFQYKLSMGDVGDLVNAYLLEREQDRNDPRLLDAAIKRFAKVKERESESFLKREDLKTSDYHDWREEQRHTLTPEDYDTWKRRLDENRNASNAAYREAYQRMEQAVGDAFAKEIEKLGDILAAEPIMTESGQYVEQILPETPIKTSRQVADEIANELVRLPKYQARCKLSQRHGRPLEYSIETLPFTGSEDYRLVEFLTEWSRERFGRDRKIVEKAIEQRLQILSERTIDEEEAIIREKAKREKKERLKHKPSAPVEELPVFDAEEYARDPGGYNLRYRQKLNDYVAQRLASLSNRDGDKKKT